MSAIGPNGMQDAYKDPNQPALWGFIGACCLLTVGVYSFFIGFAECVQDAGSTKVTTYAILLTQV